MLTIITYQTPKKCDASNHRNWNIETENTKVLLVAWAIFLVGFVDFGGWFTSIMVYRMDVFVMVGKTYHYSMYEMELECLWNSQLKNSFLSCPSSSHQWQRWGCDEDVPEVGCSQELPNPWSPLVALEHGLLHISLHMNDWVSSWKGLKEVWNIASSDRHFCMKRKVSFRIIF